VAYVWTLNGPEPVALPHAALDYDHYADTQVLSVARSIAAATYPDSALAAVDPFPRRGDRRAWQAYGDGQLELW
jgi:hypothetical protein